jgi:hypothetical protein
LFGIDPSIQFPNTALRVEKEAALLVRAGSPDGRKMRSASPSQPRHRAPFSRSSAMK